MPESPFYWTPALKSGQAEEEEEDEEEKEEEEDVLSVWDLLLRIYYFLFRKLCMITPMNCFCRVKRNLSS